VYPWVWIPAGCAVALLTVFVVSRDADRTVVTTTDVALAISAIAIVFQLVPLPVWWLRAADPHALTVRASLWLTTPDAAAGHLPISIVPDDTFAALGIFASAVLLFWTCRRICESGGTGRLVRSVAVIGLVASTAAIVQRAQSHDLLYGIWRPLDAGARPYGPFVNRNHFATWIVMACPLVFGYLLARAPSRAPSRLISQRVVAALKHLGSMRIWLVASVCVMTLALLISASRSGLIGLMCAMVASMLLRRKDAELAIRRWTIVQAVVLAMAALSFASFDALLNRFDETLQPSQTGRGRSAIWADTGRMIRDFPMTGTGAGTFGTGITVYQTAEPGYSIGNAHNHYLQLAAEGGVLVVVPAALTIAAFFALCARRLKEDTGRDYLVRAGAVAGIVAVLLQSFWETGLRMPANAMLLAVLAAIATHSPSVLNQRVPNHQHLPAGAARSRAGAEGAPGC
jgi:O-antigen ligase